MQMGSKLRLNLFAVDLIPFAQDILTTGQKLSLYVFVICIIQLPLWHTQRSNRNLTVYTRSRLIR